MPRCRKCPDHGVKLVDVPWARKGTYVSAAPQCRSAQRVPGRVPSDLGHRHGGAMLPPRQGNRQGIQGEHDGDPEQEVVCDMSPAFLSGVAGQLPKARVTVDWFHIVQTSPGHWMTCVGGSGEGLAQASAVGGAQAWRRPPISSGGTASGVGHWRVKERLRWVRQAPTPRAAKWRITRFINYASEPPTCYKGFAALRTHAERVSDRTP